MVIQTDFHEERELLAEPETQNAPLSKEFNKEISELYKAGLDENEVKFIIYLKTKRKLSRL